MPYTQNYFKRKSTGNGSVPYLLLAISGLTFCFFLGFPFDNHNESFLLAIVLSKASLWDTLTRQISGGVETFRPLGMANAWLSYKLTGNIYLQQLLNWLFAISSFALLFSVVKNNILFSFLSFVVCACFFAGYIYLFHLHGVFYGPFQLYVAALTCIAYKQQQLSVRMLTLTAAATLVVCLYHTFALLVFCAFLTGYLLQLTKSNAKAALPRLGISLLVTIVFTKLILQTKEFKTLQSLTDGFLASYRMTEINKGLALIAVLLAVLSAIVFIKNSAGKIIAAILTLILCLTLLYTHLPVLIVWVLICLAKMIQEKNWSMAGLIAATAILPFGSGSGSPTYVVFVLMICTFVTAGYGSFSITDHPLLKKSTLAAIVLLFTCLLVIKQNVKVPIVSAVAKPILAEQEKTRQLTAVLNWKVKTKEYAAFGLTLFDAVNLPVNAGDAISRTNRPVTGQENADAYIDFLSKDSILNKTKPLSVYVTFGDKILPGRQLIFSVDGVWNGKACVFK